MRAFLLIIAALALAEPFDPSARPLTERQSAVLRANRYQIGPQRVLDPAGQAVEASDMPFVIQRLESAERLKSLLRINIILNNSEGEKHLTAAERESIRTIAREAWPYYPLSTRKDFRRYFTPEELFTLEKDPPPVLTIPGVDLKDQEPPASEAKPQPAAPAPPPVVAQPVPAAPEAPAAPKQETPAAPAQSSPAAPRQETPPVAPAQSSPAAPMQQSPPVPVAPPLMMPARLEGAAASEPPKPVVTIDTSAAGGFYFGGSAPVPVPSSATVVAAPEPAPLPAPVAASTEPAVPEISSAAAPAPAPEPAPAVTGPKPPTGPVTKEALELFLARGPYSRDAKAMLRLIAEHAPEPARDRALNTLMFALPSVVLDGARAGDSWRGRLVDASSAAAVIALRPALVVFERKKLFFGKEELILPDAAAAYEGLGLPPPAAASAGEEAFEAEKGDWGEQKRYPDGSVKAKLSLDELSGELLAALLELDARLRGEDAAAGQARDGARLAKMLAYASLQQAHGHLKFLDPVLAEDFRRWLDYPDEWRDELAHAGAAAVPGEAARAPAPLWSEMNEAERRFRAARGGAADGR